MSPKRDGLFNPSRTFFMFGVRLESNGMCEWWYITKTHQENVIDRINYPSHRRQCCFDQSAQGKATTENRKELTGFNNPTRNA